jgi:hypothetical protein
MFATLTEKTAIRIANLYTITNSVLSDNQFGFKSNHSCVHACLFHLSAIYRYIAAGHKVGCLYVDIRNAFPSVDHDILLQIINKHNNLGLSPGWFKSYLSDRKMHVDVNCSTSDLIPVTCGVPQGSIFGPLLFNVYFNDITTKFNSSDITLYADDTAIVTAAEDSKLLLNNMQDALVKVDAHLRDLKMELNAQKTQFMVFRGRILESPKLSIRENSVHSCSTFKYLGIHIDHDLSWKTHACKLVSKVQKMLYILHRCTGKSNKTKLVLLFRAYIFPHFLYGIQLYMFCSVSKRSKLEALFRRCLRLVLRDNVRFPLIATSSLYCLLDVLPLRLLFQHTSAVLLYKVLVLKQVPALHSLFSVIETTSRNARIVPHGVIVLRLPEVLIESTRHSFSYWGAKLWNSISTDIRSATSLSTFSAKYLTHLKLQISAISVDRYNLLDFV